MKCGAQQQASVFSRRTKLLRWRLTCFQLGSIPDQGKFFIYIFVLAFNFLRLFFSLNRFFTKKKSNCFKVHSGNFVMNINNIHRVLSLRQPGPGPQTLAISGKATSDTGVLTVSRAMFLLPKQIILQFSAVLFYYNYFILIYWLHVFFFFLQLMLAHYILYIHVQFRQGTLYIYGLSQEYVYHRIK